MACEDPNSTKYPDRVFYHGRWRTPEAAERKSEQDRKTRQARNERNNPCRIWVGKLYLGTCRFTNHEREAMLNGSSD